MSEGARDAILSSLRHGRRERPAPARAPVSDFAVMDRTAAAIPPEERYARLKAAMEAIQTEFLETSRERWPAALLDFAAAQGIRSMAYGPATPEGRRLREVRAEREGPELVSFDRPVEAWKRELFEDVEAGFTTTRGGIAETGGLILWPSPEEPRLLSLVPPVHFALLDTSAIHATFFEAVRSEGWSKAMPANALLISGPSKTADIEQTLAYGVHGPKRLVVVAIRP